MKDKRINIKVTDGDREVIKAEAVKRKTTVSKMLLKPFKSIMDDYK